MKNDLLDIDFSKPHILDSSGYNSFLHLRNICFGDTNKFINDFSDIFEDDMETYVISDLFSRVVSCATVFKMGDLCYKNKCIKEVMVSYGICTLPEYEGLGLGSAITGFAKDRILKKNMLPILSPANSSLNNFYNHLGYSNAFYMNEFQFSKNNIAPSDFSFSIKKVTFIEYINKREQFLNNILHIKLSSRAMDLVYYYYNDFYFLYQNNDLIGIFIIDDDFHKESLFIPEFLFSPDCKFDLQTFSGLFFEKFSNEKILIRTVAKKDSSNPISKGMAFGKVDLNIKESDQLPYLGFYFE